VAGSTRGILGNGWRRNWTEVKRRAAPVLAGHRGIDASLAVMGDNGQMQTIVCSKRRECRVAVIFEERILGKFFRPTREWPSPGAETLLVAKTRPLVTAIACGVACVR
jgi:hypothetical protein